MIGNTTNFPSEEISSLEAARRKGVSQATIRNWIKSGKISARKVKNRYLIAVDEFFEAAERYQRGDQLVKKLRRKLQYVEKQNKYLEQQNRKLHCRLQKSDALCDQIAMMYDKALERAENVEEELAKYKIWEIMLRCPEAIRSYLERCYSGYAEEDNPSDLTPQSHWLPPLENAEKKELFYEPLHEKPLATTIICGETLEVLSEEDLV